MINLKKKKKKKKKIIQLQNDICQDPVCSNGSSPSHIGQQLHFLLLTSTFRSNSFIQEWIIYLIVECVLRSVITTLLITKKKGRLIILREANGIDQRTTCSRNKICLLSAFFYYGSQVWCLVSHLLTLTFNQANQVQKSKQLHHLVHS